MRDNLDPPVICLVTDRQQLSGLTSADDVEPLLGLIGNAARAGIDLVQIREPGLTDLALEDLVRRAVALTRSTRTRIVVNDRVDIALAAGAAGVHLKEVSMSAERVRSIVPRRWLVGRSVHSATEAVRVTAPHALDYLVAGTVFETRSKPGSARIGPAGLEEIVQAVEVPVLAIGGVSVGFARRVGRSGAAGLAAISEFVAAGAEVGPVVDNLRREFDKGRSSLL